MLSAVFACVVAPVVYLGQGLRELLEAGKVTPAISRTYTLAEVPEAIRQLVEGHGGGKIVITV